MRFFKFSKFLNFFSLILMLFVVMSVLGRAMTPISYADYYKRDLIDFNDSYDVVFLGASRTNLTFVPDIISQKLSYDNVINAASSLQSLKGSYYLAKEYVEIYHPQTIVLGVTFDGIKKSDQYKQADLIVLDRLIRFDSKIRYIINTFKGSDKLYALSVYRYRSSFSYASLVDYFINNTILQDSDFTQSVKETGMYYAGKGFVYANNTFEDGNIPAPQLERFDSIDDEKIKYLDKIVKLCQDNGVTLLLVTGPTSMARIYATENYQEALDFYDEYAQKHEIAYHNLNLLRNRMTFLPDSKMYDYNHVNGEGAEIVSAIYADIMAKYEAGESVDSYFYDSVDDLKKDVNKIVAISAKIDKEQECRTLTITSLQNEEYVPEYQVLLCGNDEGEYDVIQDYSMNAQINISSLKVGDVIRINCRRMGSASAYEAFQEYEISE